MPQFTGGDWRLVEHDLAGNYPYAQIRSDAHPNYYIAEVAYGRDDATEDRANFRLLTEAVRMHTLLSEMVDSGGAVPGWPARAREILAAVEGRVPCGALTPCTHDSESTCIVVWHHTVHRTECGCREPVNASPTGTP